MHKYKAYNYILGRALVCVCVCVTKHTAEVFLGLCLFLALWCWALTAALLANAVRHIKKTHIALSKYQLFN